MKELDKITTIIIEQIVEQKKTKKFAVTKMPKGNIFEYCKVTNTIRDAELVYSETKGFNKKLITSDEKIYIVALNKKNALKKLISKKVWFHTFGLSEKSI